MTKKTSVIRNLYDCGIAAYKTSTAQKVNLVLNTIRAARRKEKITAELLGEKGIFLRHGRILWKFAAMASLTK